MHNIAYAHNRRYYRRVAVIKLKLRRDLIRLKISGMLFRLAYKIDKRTVETIIKHLRIEDVYYNC